MAEHEQTPPPQPVPAARLVRRADAFYVGYLPLPRALRGWLIGVTGLLLWGVAGIAFTWARAQQDPGPAVWHDAQEKTWTGLLLTEPYPMLIEDSGSTAVLVEIGKHGAQARTAAFAGQRVKVRGWLLERDGRRVIELIEGDRADDRVAITTIGRSDVVTAAKDQEQAGDMVEIDGEIVDVKCYLGAMKPGHGITHKQCASLCIRGGIPPVLVSRGVGGEHVYTLLCGEQFKPLGPDLLPLVADPVRVRGRMVTRGDLRMMAVAPGDILRR